MSGSAIEWSPPRTIGIAPASSTCATVRSIAACERAASAGITGASPKSTIRSSSNASIPPRGAARADSSPRGSPAGRTASRADPRRDRLSARRPRRRPPRELRRILGVRKAAEREQPRVVGLLAVLAPALERIDHGAILPPCATSSNRRSIEAVDRSRGRAVRAHRLEECLAVERVEARLSRGTTVAVRGPPRSSAISPTRSPRPSSAIGWSPTETSSCRPRRGTPVARSPSRMKVSPAGTPAGGHTARQPLELRRAEQRESRRRAEQGDLHTGTVAPRSTASKPRPASSATIGSTARRRTRRPRTAERDEHRREDRAEREPSHGHPSSTPNTRDSNSVRRGSLEQRPAGHVDQTASYAGGPEQHERPDRPRPRPQHPRGRRPDDGAREERRSQPRPSDQRRGHATPSTPPRPNAAFR